MLFIVAFALAALLMHISGRLWDNPMALIGFIYLGGIGYAFILIALKVIGVTT